MTIKMVLNQEMLDIKRFFIARDLILCDFWLESCINWFHEQNPGYRFTQKELQLKVYEQWLLFDLRDVKAPSLPHGLTQHKKYILNGNYSLQMLSAVDISKPKHLQLNKIRNANLAVTLDQEKDREFADSKRVLQLTLTDGVQEIEAIEYTPIPDINVNLTPGIKIRIMGPITVRRGKLFLERNNLKILGGEVDEIAISHAVENVLARSLGLQENPNPRKIDEIVHDEHRQNFQEMQEENTNMRTQKSKPSKIVSQNIQPSTSWNTTDATTFREDINEDEESHIAAEIEMLLEAEESTARKAPKPNTKQKQNDLFEDDVEFDNIDLEEIISQHNSTNKNQDELMESLNDDDDDVFNNIDKHLDKIDEQNKIFSVAELKNKNEGSYKTRAAFKMVVEKLTVANNVWNIKICIEDSTDEINCVLHSDVVTNLIKYEPSAFMNLRNQGDNGRTQIMKTLSYLKSELLLLDNVMDIKISKDKLPIITAVHK